MADIMSLRGELAGHAGWVTCIATSEVKPDLLVSGSRDHTVIAWTLTRDAETLAVPTRRLMGHKHNISDVQLSLDGHFAISASWDGSCRLFDLSTGEATRQFHGAKKDVLSVAFSPDQRQVRACVRVCACVCVCVFRAARARRWRAPTTLRGAPCPLYK